MAGRLAIVVALHEMVDGQEADFFAQLSTKEELKTRQGKPYHRVAFRDAGREVGFPIWNDSAWSEACKNEWRVGACYKMRAVYRETQYGPQLEIKKIREVAEGDKKEGFDEQAMRPAARRDSAAQFAALLELVKAEVADTELKQLLVDMLETNRAAITVFPAATRMHHAFVGGFIDHILSVTRNCVFLADKYLAQYPQLAPTLSRDLVIAGGVLHDIGKLRELEPRPEGAAYTAAGELIGHVLQGRDMLREAAAGRAIDPEILLRLEHIIVAHQRLPEWGAPKPPMTPEALLVHYADDIDAKMEMFDAIHRDEPGDGPVTSARNGLQQKVYRGKKK